MLSAQNVYGKSTYDYIAYMQLNYSDRRKDEIGVAIIYCYRTGGNIYFYCAYLTHYKALYCHRTFLARDCYKRPLLSDIVSVSDTVCMRRCLLVRSSATVLYAYRAATSHFAYRLHKTCKLSSLYPLVYSCNVMYYIMAMPASGRTGSPSQLANVSSTFVTHINELLLI